MNCWLKIILIFILVAVIVLWIIYRMNIRADYSNDLNYYKRITGLKFPTKLKDLEIVDNAEFMTCINFKIQFNDLKDFIKTNKFKKRNITENRIMFNTYLTENHQLKNLRNDYYSVDSSTTHNDWIFLVDSLKAEVWGQIWYPDWSQDSLKN